MKIKVQLWKDPVIEKNKDDPNSSTKKIEKDGKMKERNKTLESIDP